MAPPAVAFLQARLAHLGHYAGKVDGDYGPRTAEAVRTFRLREGLAPAQRMSPQAWRRLLALTGHPSELYELGAASVIEAGGDPAGLQPGPAGADSDGGPRAVIRLRRKSVEVRSADGVRILPAAVGSPRHATPTGDFRVRRIVRLPGGLLGTCHIQFEPDGLSIHGTDQPWRIGREVTLGCVALYNRDIDALAASIRPGSWVTVVE